MLIHAARDELLLDDAVRLAAKAGRAGVNVTLDVVEDSVHAFVLFAALPEAAQALGAFANQLEAIKTPEFEK